MTEEMKFCRQSRVYRSGRVFPNDFNNHNTLFGGRLLSNMDQVASIAYFTFIALDENGRPYKIPGIVPETEEERYLYETAKQRNNYVAEKKQLNKELVSFLKKKL